MSPAVDRRRGKGRSLPRLSNYYVCPGQTKVYAPGRQPERTIPMAPPHPYVVRFPASIAKPNSWGFVMVAASVETVSAFLHEVRAGPRAYSTLAVWLALAPYVKRDTGQIDCSQRQLAKTAGVALGDVSRALERLIEMGVLLKEGRGRYRVHPSVMWRGELAKRGQAEAGAPVLTLVEGGRED